MDITTQKDIEYFLEDFEKNSSTELVQETKEVNELYKIAEARGIIVKGSRDLGIFKTIYAFTDRPNDNGAILPQKDLLKILPQVVGKPVNINHNRRLVVGYYIDYRYIQKKNQIIAYGIFFKSNFGKEWEQAQKLFAKKKLSSSFEIWNEKHLREYNPDGSYEMKRMEISGGALVYQDKDNVPAFEGADVLSIAKNLNLDTPELAYATKHKENEIMFANQWKESVEENLKKLEAERNPVHNMKCANCTHEFETSELVDTKCPQCFSILKSDGSVLYPPQIKDFNISCPSCRSNNWLITKSEGTTTDVKCQSCSKDFEIQFAVPEKSDLLDKIKFLYVSSTSCPQCGTSIGLSGTSDMKEHEVSCKKCGLAFKVNTEKLQSSRQVKSIVEKSLEERRKEEEMTQEKEKEETKVEEPKKEEVKTDVTPEVKTEKTEVTTETKATEEPTKETPKVEETVKDKATKEQEKVVESSTETPEESPEGNTETEKPSEESTEPSKDTTTEQPTEPEAPKPEAETTREEEPKAETKETLVVKTPEEPIGENEKFLTEEELKNKATEQPKEEVKEEMEVIDIDDDFFETLENSTKNCKTKTEEKGEKLTYQNRKNLSDDSFAVVKVVKNKSGSTKKVRMFPIQDKNHVRNALARLPLATKTLEKLGVSPRTVMAKILKKAKQLGMKDLVERHKATLAEAKYVKKLKRSLDKAVEKIVKMKDNKELATAQAKKSNEDEFAKIREEADKKIEFAMANARTIVERRLELGTYAESIDDKDIVNNDVYEKVKLEKENAILRAKNQGGDDIVSAHSTKDSDYYKSIRDEITNKAFDPSKRDRIV